MQAFPGGIEFSTVGHGQKKMTSPEEIDLFYFDPIFIPSVPSSFLLTEAPSLARAPAGQRDHGGNQVKRMLRQVNKEQGSFHPFS